MATNPLHIVSPGEGNLGGPKTAAQKSAKPKNKPTYYKPKPKSKGLVSSALGAVEHGLKSDVKVLKKADDVQSKVTGIHAKTVVKTYADPFRKDYWKQLGGSGKSILSPQQQKEQQAFADSVMAFHGLGGAGLGLAKVPKDVRNPLAVAAGHGLAQSKPAAVRLATEEAGTFGLRRGAKAGATKVAEEAKPGLQLYRGTHPAERGISVPENGPLFASTERPVAQGYAMRRTGGAGRVVGFNLKSDSKILYPTRDEVSAKGSSGVLSKAKREGYDAVVFPDQNWEGVAVLNNEAVHRPPLHETVQEHIPHARTARKAQEKGYSTERGKRSAAYQAALKENPSLAGEAAASAHLSGELPKVPLEGGLAELTPETVDAMIKTVAEHPHLQGYQQKATINGIKKAMEGITPTHSELDKIEYVFGKPMADALSDPVNLSKWQYAKGAALDTLNIPRSVMASFDMSAPFRQGLVAGMRHPVIFSKNFGPMVKSFANQKVADGVMAEIHARPNFPRYQEAKLAVQEVGGKDVAKREEAFPSNIAERIVPPIKMSSRAYTVFLTKMRADVFDHLLPRLEAEGHDINDPVFLQGLGKYINAATGRGSLGNFEGAGHLLNTLFFSPRLMMSRLNLLSPRYYMHLPPGVRKEALRAAIQTVGTLSTMLSLAAYGGAKVVNDPRNADFGKIKIGNTRIDIAAGFQQPIKTVSQLLTATRISSQTGKKSKLGGGYGQASRFDVGLQFFTNKLSPPASVVADWSKGENFGKPFSWKGEAESKLSPLLAQDAIDIYKDRQGGVDGITAAFLGYGIGGFGFGIQTYGQQAPGASSSSKTSSNPLADTSGGSTSNPLASSSGGGNANPMAVGG